MLVPERIEIGGFPGLRASPRGAQERPVVLFLHGAFSHHDHFRNFLGFFSAAGFPCYAMSRRGRFGVPPADARGVRCEDYLEDTLRVVSALGSLPIIVGHSLGGLIAQKLAEAGRCRAAVLLMSAPPGVLTPQLRSVPALLPLIRDILRGAPLHPPATTFLRVALNRIPACEQQRLCRSFVAESGLVYRQMLLGDVRVDESKVRCPILCVGGSDDRIISRGLVRSMARKYKAELQEHARQAHWALEEPGWEDVAEGIASWLRTAAAAAR